jgi:uncharacterized membrane protein
MSQLSKNLRNSLSTRSAVLVGCVWAVAAFALQPLSAGNGAPGTAGAQNVGAQKGKPGAGAPAFATVSTLPSFGGGGNSVAWAVDEAGTVIVGQAYDRDGFLHAVKWTLQNGSWVMTDLPWPPGAVSATAAGVDNQGVAAGNGFYSGSGQLPVLWPATGGPTILGCPSDLGSKKVYGISAVGQVVVGTSGGAAAWRPGSCQEHLPHLVEGGSSGAFAVNGDGTIVGGVSALTGPDGPIGMPVRWRNVGGLWSIEQLDSQSGSVRGANGAGDLAGYVYVPCGSDNDCQRAVIWFAIGGSHQLDTLGGDASAASDVNGSGEVVGISMLPRGDFTAFFWSQSVGMVPLPTKGRSAQPYALSDVRPDGTRLVVGVSNSQPIVWVVR